MTKLQVEELTDYFQKLEKQLPFIDYNSYIFPEELTAEFIAQKFDVTLSTALRRLKELEKSNYLISKRANVTGKLGKRLVFFRKEDVVSSSYSLPSKVDFPPKEFLQRELAYIKYSRKWEIKENFDTRGTLDLIVRNISNKIIEEVVLPKIVFDTFDNPDRFDTLISIEIDGTPMPYTPTV